MSKFSENANRETWEKMLAGIAVDASAARVERNKANDSRLRDPSAYTSKERKKYLDPNTYYQEILKELKKKYPYESASVEEMVELNETKPADVMDWIYFKGKAPGEIKADETAAKFIPILQGVAPEGDDWMTMGNERLKNYAVQLGYKVSTPEQYKKFLDKVGEYQQQFDRGQIDRELRDDPLYPVMSLVYPSMVQEAENAIITGEGGDKSDLLALGAVDFLANAGTMYAPAANIKRLPSVVNTALGVGTQAAAEASRQGLKAGISETGQEFDFAPVVFTATAGATTPTLLSGIQGGASRIPGEPMKNFSRGLMKAKRSTNPTVKEREALEKGIKDFNESDLLKVILDGSLEGTEKTLTPAQYEKLQKLNGIDRLVQDLFGVSVTPKGIDAATVLKSYDKPVKVGTVLSREGVELSPRSSVVLDPSVEEIILDEASLPLYKSQFPAKYDEMIGKSKMGRLGEISGRALLDVGGSVEPALKVSSYDQLTSGKDYKTNDFYAAMNEDQQKIVDEAFKQKDIENAFQELKARKPEAVRRALLYIEDSDLENPLTNKERELVETVRQKSFARMMEEEQ